MEKIGCRFCFCVQGMGDATQPRILAASLAARSDHPVSQAVARAATEEKLALREGAVFSAFPGRGVRGSIEGHVYQLGNHRLMEELGLCSAESRPSSPS